ncbi:hypothetical protein K461DRAFT_247745 [Myriangium duriaei CBS 260.36]|uniref:DUF8004 domain-containing protein n=1 Tax=Myriangium duriaei CBS 260.36 TaxID=1168546 RepID=A0A9P4IRG3_9PEZI|nr:hypothetical protein K461DRAFT_247745 [Myriangium duriaei CBS 260.36]
MARSPGAWLVAFDQQERIAFDVDSMMAGQPVHELWDETGDCYIHLFPRSTGKGPSFRLSSSVFASSASLTKMAFGRLYSDNTLADQEPGRDLSGQFSIKSDGSRSTRQSLEEASGEVHLHLDLRLNGNPAPVPPKKSKNTPISEDAETMIEMRNLFGFLCGQALVATEKRFTLFSIFMRIAEHLQRHEFSNMDSSTFGEVASSSFDSYVNELQLADVRRSSEKAVEMLLLGERMRSVGLYNEAFTHAVGKLEDIKRVAPTTYNAVSSATQTRLSRAAMDLEKRIANASATCTDFDMPSIFSGIMSSRTVDERQYVNFDAWKSSFFTTRKFIVGYYKALFGSWPPKPNPKKNQLQSPGLSRIVLLQLYNDLSAVYDLIVDHTALTNRTADGVSIEERSTDPPRIRALRHVLSEWDRSSPPVKPPMPFDIPNLPRSGEPKISKKFKSEDLVKVLQASHNPTSRPTSFVQAFREFERSQAKGCTIEEIADLRYGQWIFMYAVLQELPLLVVDAPSIRYTAGVEYFLCEASRGGVPWARDAASAGRSHQWYGVAGGAGVVSLPSDVIENSIEAIYRRSHCWIMAQQWSAENPIMAAAVEEQQRAAATDLVPPPPIGSPGLRVDSRSSSPARSKRESVLNLGLEAIPLPSGVSPDRRVAPGGPASRPVSMHVSDPAKTFDAILADVGGKPGKKRK